MKYIEKKKQNEPACLKEYRTTTPDARYQSIMGLNEALMIEQGHICAYCTRRISLELNVVGKPKVEIEHILPRETHLNDELEYKNLVAVCNGKFGINPHCDKTKKYDWKGNKKDGKIAGKVKLTKLFPTNKNCEKLISFNQNGLIKSINSDEIVEEDILKLNLNDEKIKGFRKNIIDATQKRIENSTKNRDGKTWKPNDFDKEIEFWTSKNSKGEYKEFFQIAVWYLGNRMTKPIYK